MPWGYSRSQILLHWAVAALVLAQYLNDSAIGAAWRALMHGDVAAPTAAAYAHIAAGVLILMLVLWRLALRATHGAPPLPVDEPRPLRILATATHWGLYLLLVAACVSGGLAWFGDVRAAAGAHEAIKTGLLLLVGLHVAGALYQRFMLKSDVMTRMIRPGA